MKLFPVLLAVLMLAVGIQSVSAQNTWFLRQSPIAHLDDDDEAILRETIMAVLEAPDGTTTDWYNPESGSKGRIQVLDTHEAYDTTCRRVRGVSEADGRRGGGEYRLCLSEDGNWRFAPTS